MEITLDIGYPSNLLYSDVSISVPDHGIISFVGDNGCGKSTLLKTLAGIINPMRGVVPSELLNMNFMVSNYISIPEEVKVKDIYDFRGVSGVLDETHPQYGLYRFKKGFNAEFTEFIGEIYFDFKPFVYKTYKISEKIFKKARGFIRRLKGEVKWNH